MDSDYPPREAKPAGPGWTVKAIVTAADEKAPVVDAVDIEISHAGRAVACFTFQGADTASAADWDQIIRTPGFFRLRLDPSRGGCIISTGGRAARVVFITGGAKIELPREACLAALESVKRTYSEIQRRRASED